MIDPDNDPRIGIYGERVPDEGRTPDANIRGAAKDGTRTKTYPKVDILGAAYNYGASEIRIGKYFVVVPVNWNITNNPVHKKAWEEIRNGLPDPRISGTKASKPAKETESS